MGGLEERASSRRRALICDDSALHRMGLQKTLSNGFECSTARDADEALSMLRGRDFDLLLLDISMRSEEEGLEFLPRFRSENPNMGIVISSNHSTLEFVRRALTEGADDYLEKSSTPDEVLLSVEKVLRLRELAKRSHQQSREIHSEFSKKKILGSSQAIEDLRSKIEKLRHSDVNVIIQGESGTGKELVAKALRREDSDGVLESFVSVDSSTIQSNMAESLLFGHEKGAFTGADKARVGMFEEADGGAIYFDEVSNMPLEIQRKLLRVVQEKEVTRLGASKPRALDFRVICATNQDLEKLVEEGKFQFDLLYRLGVVTLRIPPLRERREDIPLFVEHFLRAGSHQNDLELTPETLGLLMEYDWPGNVRELSNVISFLRTMADGKVIRPVDLPTKLRAAKRVGPSSVEQRVEGPVFVFTESNYHKCLKEFEREFIIDAYKKADGKIAKLARLIGLDRSYLYSKLKNLDLFPVEKLKTEAGV